MNSNPSFLRIFSEARLWGDAQRRLATVAIFPRRIRARRTLLPLRSPCPSSASRDGTRLRNSPRRAYRATAEVRRTRWHVTEVAIQRMLVRTRLAAGGKRIRTPGPTCGCGSLWANGTEITIVRERSIRNAHMERHRHCRCRGGELRRTLALLRRAQLRNREQWRDPCGALGALAFGVGP